MPHVEKHILVSFLHRNLKRCHKKVKIDFIANLFVKLILNYGTTVLSPYTQHHTHKLEAIQRCAARFVMSDYCRTSSMSAMIISLHWQSISRSKYEELHLIMFFKIVNTIVELPLPDYITLAPRVTRGNSIKFVMPSITVNPYKFSFFPRSIDQQMEQITPTFD